MPLPTKTIELNAGFKKALHLMEKTNKNILIAGRAGKLLCQIGQINDIIWYKKNLKNGKVYK